MQLLFAVTLFVGAVLLFLVQPMFARMALPLLGGTPAVWNTCVVFFQAALLAGYAYAHWAPTWLGVRRHSLVHLGLLALPLLAVPISIPDGWTQPSTVYPSLWLLGLLLTAVGLPFVVVSTTAPLLQRWFASTGHRSAGDPYFLYAASNLGSMLALLSYPVLVEPLLPLGAQSLLWTAGYGLLMLLVLACAVAVWTSQRTIADCRLQIADCSDKSAICNLQSAISWRQRLRWVVLAALPCSLMLSVTTYLTMDVAPIPLLWVLPLAIYLLTFILAFGRRPLLSPRLASYAAGLIVLLLTLVLLSEATEPVWLLLPLHLLGLFVIALFCHTQLAQDRPEPQHLTEFYLWLSAGGVLGGLCNVLLAPLLFKSLLEYPLALVLAGLLRAVARPGSWNRLDLLLPIGLGLFAAALVAGWQAYGLPPGQASVALMFAGPAVVCYTFIDRPLRFGLGIAALLLAGGLYQGVHGQVLQSRRSYFGVHRVTLDPARQYRRLVHGNTVHGMQSLDPTRRHSPLTYYHKDGPAGHLHNYLKRSKAPLHQVGVIGLGVGSLAAYGETGQRWTFYEIDPVVVDLAHNSRWFSFTRDCRAEVRFEVGDARLKLAETASPRYDLLYVDAFNSDSLPVHLLTREALQVYLRRLNEHGVLAFHVSNRYLDLEPLLAELAHDARLVCVAGRDSDDDARTGKYASRWVILGRSDSPVGDLAYQPGGWHRLQGGAGQPLWTDNFSNLLQLFRLTTP